MRKHPLAECERCPLVEDGKFVPSLIPLGKPRLAVVGEAPGVQEAAYGQPFKGPSGQLLDRVLGHYGYSRSQVMYTNACLCRPPNNATPPKAAINSCRARLNAELAESEVEDIIALGGTAASVLVDDPRSITHLRVGPPKAPTRLLSGSATKRVIPTWHPAYCLRNADAFPTMVTDIGKLRSTVSTWKAPDWKAFENPDECLRVLEALADYPEIYFDIEVGIEKDTSFDHPNEYEPLCIGLAYAPGKAVVLGETAVNDKEFMRAYKAFMNRPDILTIAHNRKFDQSGLYPHIGPIESPGADTMLGNYCLDERPGIHRLEVVSIEKLGSPSWKHALEKYIPKGGNYANVPRPVLYQYNAYDVANGYDIWQLQKPLLNEYPKNWFFSDHPYLSHHEPRSLRHLHDFLIAASNQLMYPELNGVPIDRNYSNELVVTYLDRINPLEDQLSAICNESTKGERDRINPRSPKQIKEYLESQGVRVSGTDKDILGGVLSRAKPGSAVHEFVGTLLEHRRQQKLYSTYVVGIRKRLYRGRVYTTYLLHGSTSGRLASRNPNLQNIVRDKAIKRQFVVSKPENVFVAADYKQAEARVIATLAQDEYLRYLLSQSDRDIFDELCDQIYGPGKWQKSVERVRIKALFYGSAYGRTPYSVAQEFKMSVTEASKMYNDLMNQFPDVVKRQEETKRKIHNGEDLITTFGRRRRFWLITAQNKKDVENEALSFEPQSTASDICLAAFTQLRPMLRGLGFIRLTIHDALVAEGPEDKKDEIADMLRSVMEEEGRKWTTYVPFPVDVSFGKSWGDLS